MDITVRRGSLLYPWETENPFIGWAREPDWRKWIIGNRSVPAVIMLQRRCRTLPLRWDGMLLLVLFPLHLSTELTQSYWSLFPTLAVWPSLPSSLVFCLSLFHTHTCYQTQTHTWSAVESFSLTFPPPLLSRCLLPVKPLLRKKYVADHVTFLSLLSFWSLDFGGLGLAAEAKMSVSFFSQGIQGSVALSQLKKRHEINVMSMAFSRETPRHLVKVTLHSPPDSTVRVRWRMSVW